MAKSLATTRADAAPTWAGDYLIRENLVQTPAKLDAAAFSDANGVLVNVTAIAAIGATSVAVTALLGAIPSGTTLDFGGAKFARLTADAAVGATTLTVAALPTALAVGDKATYSEFRRRTIKSGTLIGRTYAERDAGTPYGPAVDTDDEFYILAFTVQDAFNNNDCELYRTDSVVKENFLPEWATISANAPLLAKLRAKYICIKGQA